MTETTDFLQEVKQEMKYIGLLQIELSNKTGIKFSRLKGLMAGTLKMTDEEKKSIEKILGMEN